MAIKVYDLNLRKTSSVKGMKIKFADLTAPFSGGSSGAAYLDSKYVPILPRGEYIVYLFRKFAYNQKIN